jgi:hypothetical protein
MASMACMKGKRRKKKKKKKKSVESARLHGRRDNDQMIGLSKVGHCRESSLYMVHAVAKPDKVKIKSCSVLKRSEECAEKTVQLQSWPNDGTAMSLWIKKKPLLPESIIKNLFANDVLDARTLLPPALISAW